MKKIALLCVILFCLGSAKAQLEWAPVGAKYYYETWWDTGVSGGIGTTVVEVVGDTVVMGKACRYLQKTSGYIWWLIPCQGYDITYEEAGRVYFYDELAQSFTLFYDFNKEPGDIWEVPFCYEEPCDTLSLFFQLDSITYTEFNGIQVKTQHLKYRVSWSEEWYSGVVIYEGIGNARFIHFYSTLCLVIEAGFIKLNCYESPVAGTINFWGDAPCDISTSTDDPTTENLQILLSPNPVSNELKVRFTLPVDDVQLRIFDMQGRLVQDLQKEAMDASMSLTVSEWPAGMYLLQVLSEGKIFPLQRFVKL